MRGGGPGGQSHQSRRAGRPSASCQSHSETPPHSHGQLQSENGQQQVAGHGGIAALATSCGRRCCLKCSQSPTCLCAELLDCA